MVQEAMFRTIMANSHSTHLIKSFPVKSELKCTELSPFLSPFEL